MIWSFLFAHFLVDFVLQSKETAENKLDWKNTLKHCLWIFGVTLIIVLLTGFRDWKVVPVVLTIAITHGFIDFLKAKIENKLDFKWSWLLFAVDQLLHVTIIFVSIIIFYPDLNTGYTFKISTIFFNENIIKIFSFLILITFGGCYFTAKVCRVFEPVERNTDTSLSKAGRYIGILERLIVTASILIGRYEIIGFLIAAKSIIRHPEKDDKKFAEYFLIGTFTSFIWAAFFTFLFIKL
ncbi:MAG: hypothetical protein APR54_09930 [Candidatus Cloacimonas sp. SDB]|nr:MAG: hypothetical protein APR54_09930 [Candidatus Cloacimonas sp. SDB]